MKRLNKVVTFEDEGTTYPNPEMANEEEYLSGTKKSLEEIVICYSKKCVWINCYKPAKKRCSRCKWAYYCCAGHQRMDWEGVYSSHADVCEKAAGPLFRDAPLVYACTRKNASHSTTPLNVMIRRDEVFLGSTEDYIAVIEWGLQQPQLRPENEKESVDLFRSTLSKTENEVGLKILRLLLRYNVTPIGWTRLTKLAVSSNRYYSVAQQDIIDLIYKVNLRRVWMETEAVLGGWRPWTHSQYVRTYRNALRTLVVLAKASRVRV
jgi:hypothetical protein